MSYRFTPDEFDRVSFSFDQGPYQITVGLHPAYHTGDLVEKYGWLDPVLAWILVLDSRPGKNALQLRAQYDGAMTEPFFLDRDYGGFGKSISGSGRSERWTVDELKSAIREYLVHLEYGEFSE